jgi:hypothetical protein
MPAQYMSEDAAYEAAAMLTLATYSGSGASLVIGQNGTLDPTVLQKNRNVWECFRVFYAVLIGAAADPTDFPPPPGGSNGGGGGGGGHVNPAAVTAFLTQMAAQTPAIAAAVQTVLAVLQGPNPTPTPVAPPSLSPPTAGS